MMYSSIKQGWAKLENIAPALVWGLWGGLLLINLVAVGIFGHNIPLAEGWTMVAPLTGNEPDFWQWLWSQNNEHRLPVPRLIFLGLLKLSNGDFRVGMVYNVLVLAGMAAASMLVIRRIRHGKTHLADGVFPLALMHWGHWPNLFWSWQLSFVTPIALIYASFLTLLQIPTLSTVWAALVMGVSALLLPLCGGIGLIFMPFFTIWLTYCGYWNWQNRQSRLGLLLWGFTLGAIAISGLYFVGYEKPYWNPPSPGIGATLATAAKFVALGLGPVASKSWPVFVLITFGFLATAIAVLLPACWKAKDSAKSYGLLEDV